MCDGAKNAGTITDTEENISKMTAKEDTAQNPSPATTEELAAEAVGQGCALCDGSGCADCADDDDLDNDDAGKSERAPLTPQERELLGQQRLRAAQGDGRSGLAALNTLAADVLAMCKARGWSLHWTHRGAYLHLETSELIEAVRGKRGSVVDEAGDVLLVLMSITEYAGIPFTEVVGATTAKVDGLFTKPHYAGEECLPSEAGTDLLDTLRAAANFIIKPSGREPETREVVIKALDIAIRKEEGNCAALAAVVHNEEK